MPAANSSNISTIQILRSYANSAPLTLDDGQLAYSFVSNTLFIGSNTGNVIAISEQATANLVRDLANTKVNRVGDTITGPLYFLGPDFAVGNFQTSAGYGIDFWASQNSGYAQINYANTNFVYVDPGSAVIQSTNATISAYTTGNAAIWTTGNNGVTSNVWTFDNTGKLNLPGIVQFADGTQQNTAYIPGNPLYSNVITTNTVNISTNTSNVSLTKGTGITSWNYSGKSLTISAQEAVATGIFLKPDGTKMYLCGQSGDKVVEYVLSTAWDISTGTYNANTSIVTQDTSSVDLFFKPDGTGLYVLGDATNAVLQYSLSTPWDITSTSFVRSFSIGTQDTTPAGLWFKPDGTTMYMLGNASDYVYQYTLGTAWDISTASYASISFYVGTQDTAVSAICLNPDGTKMWVSGQTNDKISEYNLVTPWNVSTAIFVNNFNIGFESASSQGLFIDFNAPNRVYVIDSTDDAVYQYNTDTNSIAITTDVLTVNNNARIQGNVTIENSEIIQKDFIVRGQSTLGTVIINGTLNACTAGILLDGSATNTIRIASNQTTGNLFIGGATQTGNITFGYSSVNQTANIANGNTAAGSTKTVNLGTSAGPGSNTRINIGPSHPGANGNVTFNPATTVAIQNTKTSTSNITGALTVLGGVGVSGNVNSDYEYSGGYFYKDGTPITNTANNASANTIIIQGVDVGQNARMTIIEGTDTSQNARMTIIEGVNTTQNTRLTVIENTDLSQNVSIATQNSFITVIQGVDVGQNSRMTIIEGTDVTQNTRLTVIEGTDVSQNARMTIIEGANATQNTNIAATDGKMQNAYAQANTGTVLAQGAFDNSNTKLSLSGGTITGNLIINQNLSVSGNITVSGNAFSIQTTTLNIGDPLIYIGANNYSSDLVDLGIIGNYYDGTFERHTGIFRDPTRKEWIFFKDYTPEVQSNNLINIADPSFAYANLNVDILRGNLIGTTAVVNGRELYNYSSLAYGQANTATVLAQAVYNQSNTQVLSAGWTSNTVIVANSAGYLVNSAMRFDSSISQLSSMANLSIGTTQSTAPLTVSKTFTTPTGGEQFGQFNSITYSIADTNLKQGLRLNTSATHTSNTISNLIGILNLPTVSGVGGATSSLHGYWSRNDVAVGSYVTNSYNFTANDGGNTGYANNQYGFYVTTLTKGLGNYGFYGGVTTTNSNTAYNLYMAGNAPNYLAGSLWVANNVPSTSNTTGTLVVTGGLGVAGNTYLSGNVVVANTSTNFNTLQISPGYYNQLTYFGVSSSSSYAAIQYNATPSTGGVGHSFTAYGSPTSQGQQLFLISAAPQGGTSVNYLNATSNTTGNAPTLTAAGSDANVNFSFVTQGSGTFSFLNSNTTNGITFSKYIPINEWQIAANNTSNLGLVATGGGVINFYTTTGGNQKQFAISQTASAVNYVQVTGNTTGNPVILSAQGSDANVAINYVTKGNAYFAHTFYNSNGINFRIYDNGSGSLTNYWQIRGATTGNNPVLMATNSGFGNVSGTFTSGGTGSLSFYTNDNNAEQLRVTHTASAVNYVQVTGAATGGSPTISTQGSDSNISLSIGSKGSSQLYLAAGSTGGSIRLSATGAEQFVVSGPASAVNKINVKGATTGFGPLMWAAGSDTNINFEYSTVGTGSHQFYTYDRNGGSSNLQFAIAHTSSVVNYLSVTGAATSGAPTISSQGTDSTVPLAFVAKNSNILFYPVSPGATSNLALAITPVTNAVNYAQLYGAISGSGPTLTWTGTDSVVVGVYNTKGAGAHYFATNGNQQFRISDTASAVNYLQVTGSATSGAPTISTQGSDSNIDLRITTKGSGWMSLMGNNGAYHLLQLQNNGTSSVNYLKIATSVTGFYPSISATGTDTNVGFNYYTQGTGPHNFRTGSSNTQFVIADTANVVNYLQVTGSTTGNLPILSAVGSDTNVGLELRLQGSPSGPGFKITNGGGAYTTFSVQTSVASPANYVQIAPATSGNGPTIQTQGTDSNINLNLTPKGTGSVNVTSTLSSTSNTTGSLVVSGGLGLSGNLSMNLASSGAQVNRITLSPSSYIQSYTSAGAIEVGGSAYWYFSGSGGLFNQSTLYQRGAIGNDQGNNTVIFAGSSPVLIQNTAASTSNTTGALIVAGGLGVSGNASFGINPQLGYARINFGLGPYWTADTNLALQGNGYMYFNNSTGVYIQNTLYQRGTISNDQGNNTVLIASTSPFKIANTTPSTNTTTGALVVAGGVGIAGALNATTKSFNIPHPTKEGKNLRYGSLEGPEFGVYVRGQLNGSNVIELPEYWTKLVDANTITVSLTPIGKYQKLSVKEIKDNTIIINNDGWFRKEINCYYTVFGERADVDKLDVEA